MKTTPPKWADQLLTWFCHPLHVEEIQGDLHELYYYRVSRVGPGYAQIRFVWEVFRAMRLSLLRRPVINLELQWASSAKGPGGSTWNDMLFETRNKDYGAYKLRKGYGDNMLLGFSVVLILSIFLVTWWWLRFMQ